MAFKIESSLLDACALAILKRGDTYGYQITQEMKSAIEISESTLYPVLRRLQKEGYCRTYDQPHQGRNRRYYSITEKGEQRLAGYRREWTEYRESIEKLLGSGEAGAPGRAERGQLPGSGETGAFHGAEEAQLPGSGEAGASEDRQDMVPLVDEAGRKMTEGGATE